MNKGFLLTLFSLIICSFIASVFYPGWKWHSLGGMPRELRSTGKSMVLHTRNWGILIKLLIQKLFLFLQMFSWKMSWCCGWRNELVNILLFYSYDTQLLLNFCSHGIVLCLIEQSHPAQNSIIKRSCLFIYVFIFAIYH